MYEPLWDAYISCMALRTRLDVWVVHAIRNIRMSWANSCDADHVADSGDSDGVYRGADGGGYVGRLRLGRGQKEAGRL